MDLTTPKPVTKTKLAPIGKGEKLCVQCNQVRGVEWFAIALTADGRAHKCLFCTDQEPPIVTPQSEPTPPVVESSTPEPTAPSVIEAPQLPELPLVIETPDPEPLPIPTPSLESLPQISAKLSAPQKPKHTTQPMAPIIVDGQEWTPIPFASKLLNIPDRTIRNAMATGKIAYIKQGTRFFISLKDCRLWNDTIHRPVSVVTLADLYAELVAIRQLLEKGQSNGANH